MTGSRAGRAAVAAAILIVAAAGLGACGKRGTLEPPPDMKGKFKYPRQYPDKPVVTSLPKPLPKPKAETAKPKAETARPAGDGKVEKDDKAEQDSTSK